MSIGLVKICTQGTILPDRHLSHPSVCLAARPKKQFQTDTSIKVPRVQHTLLNDWLPVAHTIDNFTALLEAEFFHFLTNFVLHRE